MNDTAKKLREAADYMKSEGVASVVGDIRSTFAAIADELDKLQMKANEANNLRQQLESAEDKAERRKRHIGYLNTALHDKNGLLERRGGTIARLTAENGKLHKQVPSERERQILDMWPRFEDGDPVMPGDKVHYASTHNVETEIEVESITVMDGLFVLCDDECRSNQYEQGQRVKRPVQSVLDTDGVEVKEGDTVWLKGEPIEYKVAIVIDGLAYLTFKTRNGDNSTVTAYPRNLTHTPPDSWERLEEDAAKSDCDYFGRDVSDCDRCPARESTLSCGQSKSLDIIRRAKALAGVEVE